MKDKTIDIEVTNVDGNLLEAQRNTINALLFRGIITNSVEKGYLEGLLNMLDFMVDKAKEEKNA